MPKFTSDFFCLQIPDGIPWIKALRELMNSQANCNQSELKNNIFFVSSIIGDGKSYAAYYWLINHHQEQGEKQTFNKFGFLPIKEMADKSEFEVSGEEVMSCTSHIAEHELNLKLIFTECEPKLQTLTRCSERTDSREADKSPLSSFLLFTYTPVQGFMHNCKQTSEKFGLFSIQEINDGKDVNNVDSPSYNDNFSNLLNSLKGIETSSVFQIAPVFDRELLSLYFFTDLIPARGLKQLFASSNHKFRFWIEIFGFFANWGLRLNKFLTIDYLKLIKFSRFRGQSKNINLRGDVTKYLTLLKEENRQVLKNPSNLFGLAKINIRRFADSLLLISKLLFRRFLIDKRCYFIFLVEMPP